MKRKEIDQFVQYVKEQFGYELYVHDSDVPDSFESIFGASFLRQNDSHEVLIDFEDVLEYRNTSENDSIIVCTDSMDLAA